MLTPNFGAALTNGAGQDWRVGARLRLGPDFELEVDGTYREGGDGEAGLGIGLRLLSTF